METIISALLTLACLFGADSCYVHRDTISKKVTSFLCKNLPACTTYCQKADEVVIKKKTSEV